MSGPEFSRGFLYRPVVPAVSVHPAGLCDCPEGTPVQVVFVNVPGVPHMRVVAHVVEVDGS